MDLVGGAVDPRGVYVSKILHVKTKESGPVGGACTGHTPLDPPMHPSLFEKKKWFTVYTNLNFLQMQILNRSENKKYL